MDVLGGPSPYLVGSVVERVHALTSLNHPQEDRDEQIMFAIKQSTGTSPVSSS